MVIAMIDPVPQLVIDAGFARYELVQHGFDGRLEDANPAAQRLFKRPKEKSIGTRPRDWVHPDDYAKTMEAFTAIARYIRGVSRSGALAGALACFLLYACAGPGAIIALLSVFVLAWVTTRFGSQR